MDIHKLFQTGKRLYSRYQEDDISAIAAQVTYYLILSIFPFLIFLVTLLSYSHITSDGTLEVLSSLLPSAVFELLQGVVENIIETRERALISFGMLATIWSASTGVLAVVTGMNKAYRIKETRPFWKVRIISIVFMLGLAMALIISILLVVLGNIFGLFLLDQLGLTPGSLPIWKTLQYVVSAFTVLMVFILLYYYGPNYKVSIRSVAPGALLATISWILLSTLFSFYVSIFNAFSYTYGSLGAVIALLLWLYWSSIIILLGNEVNVALLHRKKRKALKKGIG